MSSYSQLNLGLLLVVFELRQRGGTPLARPDLGHKREQVEGVARAIVLHRRLQRLSKEETQDTKEQSNPSTSWVDMSIVNLFEEPWRRAFPLFLTFG